jgi:hypothetical protein
MAWIKNRFIPFFIAFVVMTVSCIDESNARGRKRIADAMWSVSNKEKKEIVPSYTGGESPFPIQIKNTATLKVRKSTEKRSKRKRVVVRKSKRMQKVDNSEKIGTILKDIHRVVAEKEAYNPDVDAISIEGRIESTFGAKVLIHNNWFSVGENILVAIMQTDELTSLIEDLASMDANLAKIVSDDLKTKMEGSDEASLTLTQIGKDFVELKDNFGEKHVISFVINSL